MTKRTFQLFSFLVIGLSVCISSCKTQPESSNSDQPVITVSSHTIFSKHVGETVILKGTYEMLNVSQHPERTVYSERVQIKLKDGFIILLETDVKGIRPQEEIDRLTGKTVEIKGTIGNDCLAWGNGDMASIVAPCITDIQEIKLSVD